MTVDHFDCDYLVSYYVSALENCAGHALAQTLVHVKEVFVDLLFLFNVQIKVHSKKLNKKK